MSLFYEDLFVEEKILKLQSQFAWLGYSLYDSHFSDSIAALFTNEWCLLHTDKKIDSKQYKAETHSHLAHQDTVYKGIYQGNNLQIQDEWRTYQILKIISLTFWTLGTKLESSAILTAEFNVFCSTKRGGLPDGGLISEGTAEPLKRTPGRLPAKIWE